MAGLSVRCPWRGNTLEWMEDAGNINPLAALVLLCSAVGAGMIATAGAITVASHLRHVHSAPCTQSLQARAAMHQGDVTLIALSSGRKVLGTRARGGCLDK
jgi:hypothetical protein